MNKCFRLSRSDSVRHRSQRMQTGTIITQLRDVPMFMKFQSVPLWRATLLFRSTVCAFTVRTKVSHIHKHSWLPVNTGLLSFNAIDYSEGGEYFLVVHRHFPPFSNLSLSSMHAYIMGYLSRAKTAPCPFL